MRVLFEFVCYLATRLVERLTDPKAARYRSGQDVDWSRIGFLAHLDRKLVEFATIVVVLSPIMGYYLFKTVPLVWRFWARHFGS